MTAKLRHCLDQWALGGETRFSLRHCPERSGRCDGSQGPLLMRLPKASHNLGNTERLVRSVAPLERGPVMADIEGSSVSKVILPKTMFDWNQGTAPRHFRFQLGADPEGLVDWWAGLRASPAGVDCWFKQPWLRRRAPADLRWHSPLVIHDDAGLLSNTNSAYVRSWHSILGVGSEA